MTSNFSRGSLTVFFQGLESIPCKEIGYILRTLGQNPTEDEILNIGKKNYKQTAAGDSCPPSVARFDFYCMIFILVLI